MKPKNRNWLKVGVIAIATAWLLSGCTPASIGEAEASTSSLSAFYHQKVSFKSCGSNLMCGSVKVPLNYAKPASGSIKLATVYYKATSAHPLGSVIFNPGGPGASGYDYLRQSGDSLGTANLHKYYNMVGFDPRGVGRSAPVKCLSAKDTDTFIYGDSGFPVGSAEDLAASKKAIKKFIAACVRNTGSKLRYVDTVSAARDLDILRAVMGDSKLNYLGYSYGTQLGTVYANLFPKRVGRMVLDGAVDPTISDNQQSINQIKGFDKALRDYLANCLSKPSSCPFTGTVDSAMDDIKAFLLGLEENPLPTSLGGRKLTIWGGNTGMIMALYSDTYWKYLTAAFKSAANGDGTIFLELADFYNDRSSNGTYSSNLFEANIAISCMDSRSPADLASMQAQNARLLEASPVLGRYWQYGAVLCDSWPYPVAKGLKSYTAAGAPPIMVVGTTNDPATPYSQAVSLANSILSSGFLVTFNGEGHTAYGRSNSCIDNAVDNFFISGTVPSADPSC